MASEITAVMTVARNRRVCELVGAAIVTADADDGDGVDTDANANADDVGERDGVNRAAAEAAVALASVTIDSGGCNRLIVVRPSAICGYKDDKMRQTFEVCAQDPKLEWSINFIHITRT